MLYKQLGKTGLKISAVSFGSMRWLTEQDAYRLIQRGLDAGMNYIDTSTGYRGGMSEAWSGAAVKKRRSEIYFSAKSNWAAAPTADAVRKAIDGSLKKTGLEYFDFYQIWGLQNDQTVAQALAKGGTVEGIRQAQAEGLIRHGLGFTFHGTPEQFKAAVDSGEFCCATVSYSLINRKEEELIDYAAGRGVGIFVMNPLAGGVLAMAKNPEVAFLREGGRKPSYHALRFLHANLGITSSLVGLMYDFEIDEALASLEGVDGLGESYRKELIARVSDAKPALQGTFCTACGYCNECPQGFSPTKLMQATLSAGMYRVSEENLPHFIESRFSQQNAAEELAKCTECGQCQLKCPQHLEIVQEIQRVKQAFRKAGKLKA